MRRRLAAGGWFLLCAVAVAVVTGRSTTPVRIADADDADASAAAGDGAVAVVRARHPAFVHRTWNTQAGGAPLSLLDATIVVTANLSRLTGAVEMAVTEVHARSLNRWHISSTYPTNPSAPVVVVQSLVGFGDDQSARDAYRAQTCAQLVAGVTELDAAERDTFERNADGFEWCAMKGDSHAGRTGPVVFVTGNSDAAVTFALGSLLTSGLTGLSYVASYSAPYSAIIGVTDQSCVVSAPAYPMRGHQFNFRSISDSYDTWSVEQMQQYIRDSVVFGINQIELGAPDGNSSPLFVVSQADMIVAVSESTDALHVRMSLWWPLAKNFQPSGGELFAQMKRLDSLFIPGGDGGPNVTPEQFLPLAAAQAALTRQYFPDAEIWISAQGWNSTQMTWFYDQLHTQPLDWLTPGGIAYSPHQRDTIASARASVPAKYPLRHYPDVCHTLKAQFSEPDWDTAFAMALAREPIGPRPQQMYSIFQNLQPSAAAGFGTYSDGVVDDANKFVWSALGWNPTTDLTSALQTYTRWFSADTTAQGLATSSLAAQGLVALENQWIGPLNPTHIATCADTLQLWLNVESGLAPRQRLNWRVLSALYRAHFDAYVAARLVYDQELEARALAQLSTYAQPSVGPVAAMTQANATLTLGWTQPTATGLRAQIFRYAEALWQSPVHMKLSVEMYFAINTGRGATLDFVDVPLTNAPFLTTQLTTLLALTNTTQQMAGIEQLLNWEAPCGTGSGGGVISIYDDLGDVARQKHLIEHDSVYGPDPSFYNTSLSTTTERTLPLSVMQSIPRAWRNYAESYYDAPVRVRYTNIPAPPAAVGYAVRVVYWGDDVSASGGITMYAGNPLDPSNPFVIHSSLQPPNPPRPLQFAVPSAAVDASQGGVLTFSWYAAAGRGGSGRGTQIAELWLLEADCQLGLEPFWLSAVVVPADAATEDDASTFARAALHDDR